MKERLMFVLGVLAVSWLLFSLLVLWLMVVRLAWLLSGEWFG